MEMSDAGFAKRSRVRLAAALGLAATVATADFPAGTSSVSGQEAFVSIPVVVGEALPNINVSSMAESFCPTVLTLAAPISPPVAAPTPQPAPPLQQPIPPANPPAAPAPQPAPPAPQ